MAWGGFTWWHVGPLHKIDGIMRKEDYLNILKTHLHNFLDKSAYPLKEKSLSNRMGIQSTQQKLLKNGWQNKILRLWSGQLKVPTSIQLKIDGQL